jgi:dipeptidase D
MRDFGTALALETTVDKVGNVIIRKPASPGREDRTPIVMQAHLDMVCQKNANTKFDFDSQGIEMLVDGDWVRAKGTTLGSDNGIGVASIMTILASTDIEHPALEALFTIDEETGMTGAKAFQGGLLNGRILLNLDTEEDNELTIGCAGGVDVTCAGMYQPEQTPSDIRGYRLTIRGLTGGHSGVDIHLGRANANKLMNRLLWGAAQEFGVRVAHVDGGGLRNAIPRESFAVVAVPKKLGDGFGAWVEAQFALIRNEYETTDPHAEITIDEVVPPEEVLPENLQKSLLAAIYAATCGIYRMCPEIEGLVQTSNNVARVLVGEGKLTVGCLTRSSVNSERDDLAHALCAVFGLTGAEVTAAGDYPGWQPNPDAKIVAMMSNLYEEMFGEPAHVAACHAGLECGILGANYPDIEMISFGPNIRGAHSPDERVQISSVQKYWKFLLEALRRIPNV